MLLRITADPGPPMPLKAIIGSPAMPPSPPESCVADMLMLSKPSQPISPEAVFPAPCTKVHGGLPAALQTVSPALKRGEQSVAGVTPSLSNSVPPHVLAATPRRQPHCSVDPGMAKNRTEAAFTTSGIFPPRGLPMVKVSRGGTHADP